MTIPWLRLLPGVIILALVIGVLIQRSHINSLGHKLDNERAGRIADRQSYTRAQDEAAAKNKADIARIQQKQKEVSDATENRYNRDLAELRRLRSQAPRRAPGKPGVSQVPDAPGTAPQEELRLPADQLLRAQEIELQLNSLIDWVNEQLKAQ